MKKVIWYLLKGLLYLTVATVAASLMAVFLFIYIISFLIANAPDVGSAYMIGVSDSSFKRWWWWRNSRNN
jgi:hypothetical protein